MAKVERELDLDRELREQITVLTPEQKRQVLDYARSLEGTSPRGTPGWAILDLAGTISDEEAREWKRVIEEDCDPPASED